MGYYNSDLSKFIGEQCRRVMTSIDIDIFQVKKHRRILRFIESKHNNERLGYQQNEALKMLARIARFLNPMLKNGRIEVYVIWGDPPYQKVIISDYLTEKEYKITDIEKLKLFLEVEYDLVDDDLKNKVEQYERLQTGQTQFPFIIQ